MSTSIYTISASYSWGQFTPTFCLVGLAVFILLADAFLPRLSKQVYPIVAAIGAGIAACFMCGMGGLGILGAIACGATAVCELMAWDYRSVVCASVSGGDSEEGMAEFAALPLIATAGICALLRAEDLVMLFVSLETLTLSSYALAGFFRRNQGSVEAGVKYLVLGALSTGLLVFGAAWYFGTTGSFVLSDSYACRAIMNPGLCTGFLVAMGMLLAGAFFKVGAAPLHAWIPDVYQGSPTPVSAFLAVASKAAGFVVLMKLLLPIVNAMWGEAFAPIAVMLGVVAVLTLLIGNLGAIPQQNAKRLLGYSSIGQAGFILVLFLPMSARPYYSNVCFYLLAYGLATLGAFYAISQLRLARGHEDISVFSGLGRTNPRMAALITVAFASLAGVPLTAGFIAKYYSFQAAIQLLSKWQGCCCGSCLLVVLIVCAAAGFYYYFKVLRAMYWETAEGEAPVRFSMLSVILLALGAFALVALGTLPIILK